MLYTINTDLFNKKVIKKIKELWKADKDNLVAVEGPAKQAFLDWLHDEYGDEVMCTMAGLYDKIYYRANK